MDRTLTKIIIDATLACLSGIGVFVFWVLKGRPGPLKDEFDEKYRTRNIFILMALVITVVAEIIIINNR